MMEDLKITHGTWIPVDESLRQELQSLGLVRISLRANKNVSFVFWTRSSSKGAYVTARFKGPSAGDPWWQEHGPELLRQAALLAHDLAQQGGPGLSTSFNFDAEQGTVELRNVRMKGSIWKDFNPDGPPEVQLRPVPYDDPDTAGGLQDRGNAGPQDRDATPNELALAPAPLLVALLVLATILVGVAILKGVKK